MATWNRTIADFSYLWPHDSYRRFDMKTRMKNIVLAGLFAMVALLFCSCEKDPSLDKLHGYWQSVSFDVRVTPDSEEGHRLILRYFTSSYDLIRLYFTGNEFEEFRIKNGDTLFYMPGYYFYNKGFKGRYSYDHEWFTGQVLKFELSGDGLVYRFDMTDIFQSTELYDPELTEFLRYNPVDNVEYTVSMERKEFERKKPLYDY